MKLTLRNIIQILIIFASHFVSAQFLTASDTSESTVKRYKNIIRANKDKVAFIEYSLVEKGLPRHLRNLALIESNFNTNATSGAGAVGAWQFMTAHANQYGLTDQNRNDLYRSTKIAAISLSRLYKKYNNWVTVVAAYNCGEGNISKAMASAGSSQYHIFSKYLPAETVNHVKKYLNACYATGELQSVLSDYNSSRINTIFFVNGGSGKNNMEMAQTDINAGFNLNVIADELDVDIEKIIGWNPDISEELRQKGESTLYLPKDLMPDFLLRKNKILSRSLKESSKQNNIP
jgi:membrane-bound lytic murein transglycosylase D